MASSTSSSSPGPHFLSDPCSLALLPSPVTTLGTAPWNLVPFHTCPLALEWISSLPKGAVPGVPYTSPDASLVQRGRGRGAQCIALQAPQGGRPNAWADALMGADGCLPSRSAQGLGGRGRLLGAQNLASRGGAGAEAATNRGSARTPLPAANHRSVSPSRPSRPLFPLARWPPRVSGPTTSARADQAICTRVQGPLGGVLASPSDGLLVPCTLSLICPEWLWEGRDKALRRRTLAWGGGHGTEEHRTWAEVQLWLHLSFLVLSTALPVLRGFP